MARPGTSLVVTLALAGCVACGGVPSVEKRTFRDAEGRFSYVVPPNWAVWMGEARSRSGSLFSVNPVSLEDSMAEFVAGLPGSMVPLVKEETHRFFGVVGNPVEKKTSLGGIAALQVTFPVRVRAIDPESEVTFWIARHGMWLFALRISYPAGMAALDRPAMDSIIASWKFTPLPTPDPETAPGRLVTAPPPVWTPTP